MTPGPQPPDGTEIAMIGGRGWSRHSDLNRGPAVYETAALPLSYVGSRRAGRRDAHLSSPAGAWQATLSAATAFRGIDPPGGRRPDSMVGLWATHRTACI